MKPGKPMSAVMIAECINREWYGDEQWKAWKLEYDECFRFRKSFKGKPTEEQMVYIENNQARIAELDFWMFHNAQQARYDQCPCIRCGTKRNNK